MTKTQYQNRLRLLVCAWRLRREQLGHHWAPKALQNIYDYDMEFEAAKNELSQCEQSLAELIETM